MGEPVAHVGEIVKLKGLEEIAAYLRVGRKKVLAWIQDPKSGIPVSRLSKQGPYIATGDGLDLFFRALTERKGGSAAE